MGAGADEPVTIIVYDRDGAFSSAPAAPEAYTDWSNIDSKNDSSPSDSVLDAISRGLPACPVRSRLRSTTGSKIVHEVELDDGSRLISRMVKQDNERYKTWVAVMRSEGRLLLSLEASATLPIPRLLYPKNGEGADFMLQTMLPGAVLVNGWSRLSHSAKETAVREFAAFVLQIYALEVPQIIGSINATGALSNNQPVGPFQHAHFDFEAQHTFDDISDYTNFLIEARKKSTFIHDSPDDPDEVQETQALIHLDELRGHIISAIAQIKSMPNSASLLKCVLAHGDLTNDFNILLDGEGHVTGIVDWELHHLTPAVLAVGYPLWLDYTTVNDPRFSHSLTEWLESPAEAARLRKIYEETVKAANYECWNALVQGDKLRQCVSWLFDNMQDPGCARLKKWMDVVLV